MVDEVLDVIEVNIQRLKVREIEEFEDAMGCSIDVAFEDAYRRGPVFRTLAWIVKRRTDPDFTLEQAGDFVLRLVDD